jgi:hypothetical protein
LEPHGATPPVVALNQPFAGGYILQQARRQLNEAAGHVVPAIMVEINRGLFVGRQTTTTPIAPPNLPAIAACRQRLYRWTCDLLALL